MSTCPSSPTPEHYAIVRPDARKRALWNTEISPILQVEEWRLQSHPSPPSSKRTRLNNYTPSRLNMSSQTQPCLSQSRRNSWYCRPAWKSKEVAPQISTFTNAGNIALFLNPTISTSQPNNPVPHTGAQASKGKQRAYSGMRSSSKHRSPPRSTQRIRQYYIGDTAPPGSTPDDHALPRSPLAPGVMSPHLVNPQQHSGPTRILSVLNGGPPEHEIIMQTSNGDLAPRVVTSTLHRSLSSHHTPPTSILDEERLNHHQPHRSNVITKLPQVPKLDLRAINREHALQISDIPLRTPSAPKRTQRRIRAASIGNPKESSRARSSLSSRSSFASGNTSRRMSNIDLGHVQRIGLEALLFRLVENRGFSKDTILKVWEKTRDLELTDKILGKMSQAAASEADLSLSGPSDWE